MNSDVQTALVKSFRGSLQGQDAYSIDPAHGLYAQNLDFTLGSAEMVQAGTRLGFGAFMQPNASDVGIVAMISWYFSQFGVQNTWLVFQGSAGLAKALDLTALTYTTLFTTPIPTSAVFVTDGLRIYVAFLAISGRGATAAAQVYGLGVGADTLFAEPLTDAEFTAWTGTAASAGVVTQGIHRYAFLITTRNGYTGGLSPVTSTAIPPNYLQGQFFFHPFVSTDGAHDMEISITLTTVRPEFQGGTISLIMTSASNLNRWYLVPASSQPIPSTPGTLTFIANISDDDLVTGTDVTLRQTYLYQIGDTPPFEPWAIFTYSSRMGYCTIDQAGFPVVYFSNPNAYQELSAAYNGVYVEGREIPIQGASLSGVCYIATLDALYSTTDNGGLPSTWTPPAKVDGSVGILSPTCLHQGSGKILLASEKGFYVFRGGVFPQLPLSYWQAPDWERVDWAQGSAVQIVDDAFAKCYRVMAPLKLQVMFTTNTNPIAVTTGILVNGNLVETPHLLPAQCTVTIAGVAGNTAANGTWTPTITGPTTFTIPTAGSGIPVNPSGVVTPTGAQAIMTWNYTQGDGPDEAMYALHAMTDYPLGAMASVRNINNQIEETWLAPSALVSGQAPAFLRRKLPTDPGLWHDELLVAGGPQSAIVTNLETALLPGTLDSRGGLYDGHGMHLRVRGNGSLFGKVWGLDHRTATVPAKFTFSGLVLSGTSEPGIEYLIKWFLRSEAQSIALSQRDIDAWFQVALIRFYWTYAEQQR